MADITDIIQRAQSQSSPTGLKPEVTAVLEQIGASKAKEEARLTDIVASSQKESEQIVNNAGVNDLVSQRLELTKQLGSDLQGMEQATNLVANLTLKANEASTAAAQSKADTQVATANFIDTFRNNLDPNATQELFDSAQKAEAWRIASDQAHLNLVNATRAKQEEDAGKNIFEKTFDDLVTMFTNKRTSLDLAKEQYLAAASMQKVSQETADKTATDFVTHHNIAKAQAETNPTLVAQRAKDAQLALQANSDLLKAKVAGSLVDTHSVNVKTLYESNMADLKAKLSVYSTQLKATELKQAKAIAKITNSSQGAIAELNKIERSNTALTTMFESATERGDNTPELTQQYSQLVNDSTNYQDAVIKANNAYNKWQLSGSAEDKTAYEAAINKREQLLVNYTKGKTKLSERFSIGMQKRIANDKQVAENQLLRINNLHTAMGLPKFETIKQFQEWTKLNKTKAAYATHTANMFNGEGIDPLDIIASSDSTVFLDNLAKARDYFGSDFEAKLTPEVRKVINLLGSAIREESANPLLTGSPSNKIKSVINQIWNENTKARAAALSPVVSNAYSSLYRITAKELDKFSNLPVAKTLSAVLKAEETHLTSDILVDFMQKMVETKIADKGKSIPKANTEVAEDLATVLEAVWNAKPPYDKLGMQPDKRPEVVINNKTYNLSDPTDLLLLKNRQSSLIDKLREHRVRFPYIKEFTTNVEKAIDDNLQ